MRHPKDIGDESMLSIAYALARSGYGVFVPLSENSRVDLIATSERGVRRVQCKTGRLRRGAVEFATCSTYGHHANAKVIRRPYSGEIDDFAVYCRELGAVYLVPIEDVPVGSMATMRVDPPRNSQTARIRLAAAYEVARIDVY